MKIHKKMLVAGLMLIMLLAISGCGRKNIKIALYQYTENEDGTLTITALTDKGRSEDELVVPAVLDGKSVSTIGDGAFRDDTMIIRYGIKKARRYRMFIVSQDTNFAMKGFLGFLMRYADEIPVSKDKDYMERHFYRTLNNLLVNKKEYILIYPEQEMWFNYRKPRPPKRGAYFYAAKFNVPIISCFVEMRDMDKDDTEEFKRVKYVLHILDPIYPDPEKSERDNSFDMMKKDYEQKKEAYEQIYKRPLDYAFSDSDIAGWKGTTE